VMAPNVAPATPAESVASAVPAATPVRGGPR